MGGGRDSGLSRRRFVAGVAAVGGTLGFTRAFAADAAAIAPQPYFAGVNRALEAMAKLGAPLRTADAERIAELTQANDAAAVAEAEAILDRYTLARLEIDGGSGLGKVMPGGAEAKLVEQGWRLFLVRIANPTGRADRINFSTGAFSPTPPRMMPSGFSVSQRAYLMDTLKKGPLIEKMWLMTQLYGAMPVGPIGIQVVPLSTFAVEYQVIQLFSRNSGLRESKLALTMLSNIQAINAPSSSRTFQFDWLPSRDVGLKVIDADGRACVASFIVKDAQDHIYPPQAMRLAPDLFFQPQIYRADGESVRLPDGQYTVVSWRGPEYERGVQTVTVGDGHDRIDVKLQRWIDPARWGWYSGDTHIHAAGCLHYEIPTEGVSPETMIRQVRGEGLSIGEVLTWGPSWYYQKQFFTGLTESPPASLEHPELQAANNVTLVPNGTPKDGESQLRYDVEVSGFPSSLCGHLVLLRLKEQDYPNTKLIEDWPSWNLPILKWVRAQGGFGGYAHCGAGLVVNSGELPNYEIPPFDSVGMNEVIVDVTHGYADFISGCDTPAIAELNAWYHMLNCGFRIALVGETDYPCITGERPGRGRSYVQLEHRPMDDAGYNAWVNNLMKGRQYCGDGRSHFLEFGVNGRASGDEDVTLAKAGTVKIEALVAARLEPVPTPETEAIRANVDGTWHIEHARIGNTRTLAVELVVNGIAVDRATLVADGTPHKVRFNPALSRSSWVALRIRQSGHTHPVFVQVAGKEIRASKRSAEWCRACVDKLWAVKSPLMRDSEVAEASLAYDHARASYDTILKGSDVD